MESFDPDADVALAVRPVLDPGERLPQIVVKKPAMTGRDRVQLSVSLFQNIGSTAPLGHRTRKVVLPTLIDNNITRTIGHAEGELVQLKPDGGSTKDAERFNFLPMIADSNCTSGRQVNNNLRATLPSLERKANVTGYRKTRDKIRNVILRAERFQGKQYLKSKFKTVSKMAAFCGRNKRCYRKTSTGSRRPSLARRLSRKQGQNWNLLLRKYRKTGFTRPVNAAVARERFRHAIKTVVILLKWISSLTEKEEKSDKECYGRTFTDIASEAFSSGELKDSALSFDVSQFKANREINISNEVKSILSIPSHARTPEQLQTAIYGLQHLQSFAEYPLHMQEKLCKVAWFQEIPPKRIIIRQGHYAENFYFILSGQALVRILEKNPKTGEPQLRTATIMRKGTSFGELALLHHSRRTATVVSQETIQLLTIGRDDFFDIFMGGNAPGEIPEHIRFCSSLEFMKDWPIEKLLENPQCCLFHFFKRGVVIVKDSNQSDWLYIIKSGSCRVIKQLKGVVPRLEGSAKPKFRKEEYSPSLYGLFSEDIVPKVDTGLRRPHTRARTGRTPTPVQRARIEYHQLYSKNDDNVSKMSSVAKENSQQNVNQSRPGYSESKFKCYPQVKEAHFRKPKGGQLSATARTTNSNKHNPWLVSESLDRVQEDKLLVKEGALKGPVFVQVEVLKPKDVFGLATIRFDEDTDSERTSVSLVSNGAECIMFSKRFFMQHANEQVKKVVRHHAYRYPSEPALQENLQRKVDWELYKRKLIRDVIKNKRTNTMATI